MGRKVVLLSGGGQLHCLAFPRVATGALFKLPLLQPICNKTDMLQKWMNLSLKMNKISVSDIYFSLVTCSLPDVNLFVWL
jgi:hypothetical protein